MSADRLLERLGVRMRDPSLLRVALVHRSFLNERPERAPDLVSNERLEFLGDSVINAVAANIVFERYPAANEGELTLLRAGLINTGALAELARRFELGRAIHMGKGEERSGAREREGMLADTFEAVAAAIYLDGGFEAARQFLAPLFAESLDALPQQGQRLDHKSELLARVQAERGMTPRYQLLAIEGPEHRPEITVAVLAGDERLAVGSGHSKQAATQAAARAALETLNSAGGEA